MALLVRLGHCAARAIASEHSPPSALQISHSFELLATTGKAVTDTTYRGKWLIVYFGYTRCPDACPTTLLEIGSALKRGPAADDCQPLFVTIDPKRDTPGVLSAYVTHFDRRIVGLTGTAAQVAHAANTFGVSYSIREIDDDDYLMSHHRGSSSSIRRVPSRPRCRPRSRRRLWPQLCRR